MKKFTLIICFLIPVVSFATKVFNGGTVKGVLLDNTQNPLPFSTVMLNNASDSSLYKGEITNEKGEFAKVAELADALDLGSSGETRESSSLSFRTIIEYI